MRSRMSLKVALSICIAACAQGAQAQRCPGPGASLVSVRNAINDLAKKLRSPAAADCASQWAPAFPLTEQTISDPLLRFFYLEAADIARSASEKRIGEGEAAEADAYLRQEIALRRRLLAMAVKGGSTSKDEGLNRATVKTVSGLAGALARRQEYLAIDKQLGDVPSEVIDEEAVGVWLQALYSCATFNGAPRDLCAITPADKQLCREKVETFLESVDSMGPRAYRRSVTREIASLRKMAGKSGCLAK
jgi:hypothetical protein